MCSRRRLAKLSWRPSKPFEKEDICKERWQYCLLGGLPEERDIGNAKVTNRHHYVQGKTIQGFCGGGVIRRAVDQFPLSYRDGAGPDG